MTAQIARQYADGSKPDTANGVSVSNLELGLGNLWDCMQTMGVGVSSIGAGTTTLTQANAGLNLVDASGGNVTINLPTAAAAIGALFQFKRLDASANTVTINRAGGDTIDGATSLSLSSQYELKDMRSDGVSVWRLLKAALLSTIRVNSSNGVGSANTAIRSFATVVQAQGSDITRTDSAALATAFTINTPGIYAISYSDAFGAAGNLGISLNSSQLTTNINNITAADRLCVATTGAADYVGTVATTVYLAAGSVIRAHVGVSPANAGSPSSTQFTITRVG